MIDGMDMRMMNRQVIDRFRAGGAMGGMPREKMLLLTTTGRRSGREHTTPMMFVRVGDAVIVVASNSGAPRDPDWFRNLVAHPRARVETGGTSYEVDARVVPVAERAAVWESVIAQIPMYAEHQARADRTIPLVELVPAEPISGVTG